MGVGSLILITSEMLSVEREEFQKLSPAAMHHSERRTSKDDYEELPRMSGFLDAHKESISRRTKQIMITIADR